MAHTAHFTQSRYVEVEGAGPYNIMKGANDRSKFVFDVSKYVAKTGKTLSSATGVITAGTGTAPTLVAASGTVSGNLVTWQVNDGVGPVYNASNQITNSGTCWNSASTPPGVGTLTLTFTFTDTSTLVVTVNLTLLVAPN